MRLSLLAAGIALTIGFLTGGRLTRLARLPLRHGWVAVIALLFRVSVVSPWFIDSALAPWSSHLQALALASLAIVGILNWQLPGFSILALGLFSNALVMLANGYMPVDLDAARQAGFTDFARTLAAGDSIVYYSAMTTQTLLPFLGDTIVSPPLPTQRFVYSIGDIISVVGLFLVVFRGLRNEELSGKQYLSEEFSVTAIKENARIV